MNTPQISLGVAILASLAAVWCWQKLVKCHHKFSRPFAAQKQFPDKRRTHKIHYVVCLECGKEFCYDIDELKIGTEIHVDLALNSELKGNPIL